MIQFRRAGLPLSAHPFRALALVSGTVLLTGFALPAHALAATATGARPGVNHGGTRVAAPATASGCNAASLAQWHNCTTVNGSGLKITSISGYGVSEVDGTLSNLHVEIYGPSGLIKNCGTFSIPGMGDTGPICSWTNPSPQASKRAGDYCSITWQYEGGTTYKAGGAECVGVHS